MELRRQNHAALKHGPSGSGWLRTHGLRVLILAALAGSAYLAATVRVPLPVPGFALQAAAVYRLEVGAACFVVFYLAVLAFALALDIAERSGSNRQEQP